jgi:hypothetical protein
MINEDIDEDIKIYKRRLTGLYYEKYSRESAPHRFIIEKIMEHTSPISVCALLRLVAK